MLLAKFGRWQPDCIW